MSAQMAAQLTLRLRDQLSGPMRRLRGRFRDVNGSARELSRELRSTGRGAAGMARSSDQIARSTGRATRAMREQARAAGVNEAAIKRLADRHRELRNQAMMRGGAITAAGAATTYAGQRITRAAIKPGQIYGSFDAQADAVAAIAGVTAGSDQDQLLRRNARELGATTSFSAIEAAQGQEYLAMAGFDPEAIVASMKSVLDLAKAGRTDVASASDIASDVGSAFGIEKTAEGMGRLADVIVATTTSANTNVAQLGEAMGYVGPVAKSLGVEFETTAALIGVLSNNKIKGSQAGTVLRATMSRLAAGTGEAGKAIKALGLQVKDDQGDMLPFVDILEQIREKTEGMGSAEKSALLSQLAGLEASSGLTALLSDEAFAELEELIGKLDDAKGRAGEASEALSDNLPGKTGELMSALQELGLVIGEQVAPFLTELVEGFRDGVIALTDFLRENPKLTRALGIAAIAIGGLVTALGGLMTVAGTGMMAFAGLRFGMAMLGLRAARAGRGVGVLGSAMSVLGRGRRVNLANRIVPLRWTRRLIPKVGWLALAGAVTWSVLAGDGIDWKSWIDPIAWKEWAGSLTWSDLLTGLVWSTFIPGIRWLPLAGGKLVWSTLVAPLRWAGRIAKIGWAGHAGKLAWTALIPALSWAKRIPKVGWLAAAGALVWSALVSDISWGDFIDKISWGTVSSALTWDTLITALVWSPFIPGIKWAALAGGKLGWSTLLTALRWSTFIPGIGWATIAGSLAWGLLIKDVDWGQFVDAIEWSGWVPSIEWGQLIDSVDLRDWVTGFDWGEVVTGERPSFEPIQMDGFLPDASAINDYIEANDAASRAVAGHADAIGELNGLRDAAIGSIRALTGAQLDATEIGTLSAIDEAKADLSELQAQIDALTLDQVYTGIFGVGKDKHNAENVGRSLIRDDLEAYQEGIITITELRERLVALTQADYPNEAAGQILDLLPDLASAEGQLERLREIADQIIEQRRRITDAGTVHQGDKPFDLPDTSPPVRTRPSPPVASTPPGDPQPTSGGQPAAGVAAPNTRAIQNAQADADAAQRAIDGAASAAAKLPAKVNAAVQSAITKANTLAPAVRTAVGQAEGTLAAVNWSAHGAAMMQTLAAGVTSSGHLVAAAVSAELAKARELLPSSNAKRGPLSNLTGNGEAILGTMAEGAKGSGAPLKGAIEGELAGIGDKRLDAGYARTTLAEVRGVATAVIGAGNMAGNYARLVNGAIAANRAQDAAIKRNPGGWDWRGKNYPEGYAQAVGDDAARAREGRDGKGRRVRQSKPILPQLERTGAAAGGGSTQNDQRSYQMSPTFVIQGGGDPEEIMREIERRMDRMMHGRMSD